MIPNSSFISSLSHSHKWLQATWPPFSSMNTRKVFSSCNFHTYNPLCLGCPFLFTWQAPSHVLDISIMSSLHERIVVLIVSLVRPMEQLLSYHKNNYWIEQNLNSKSININHKVTLILFLLLIQKDQLIQGEI